MQASRVLYCLYISNNHVTSLNQTKKFHYRREHGRFGHGSVKSEFCLLFLEYRRDERLCLFSRIYISEIFFLNYLYLFAIKA